jgi:hypothetical protein
MAGHSFARGVSYWLLLDLPLHALAARPLTMIDDRLMSNCVFYYELRNKGRGLFQVVVLSSRTEAMLVYKTAGLEYESTQIRCII